MIRYALVLFVLASGYYTLTFSKSLWVDDNNKLGAVGAGLAALISTVVPIIYMFMMV
jgi:hypothetical protein